MNFVNKLERAPLAGLAWLGAAVGATDLSLVESGLVDARPTVELLGSGIGDPLAYAFAAAGVVALLVGFGVVEEDS